MGSVVGQLRFERTALAGGGVMSLGVDVRLKRLSVRNFRCFTECVVDFHPRLTVFVAENGRGKTAILDAVGIAMSPFVDTLVGLHQAHGFTPADVRLALEAGGAMNPVFPVSMEAEASFWDERIAWTRNRKSTSTRSLTVTKYRAGCRDIAEALRAHLTSYAHGDRTDPPVLPAVAFYGTGRLWSEHRLTKMKRTDEPTPMTRVAGYIDCLSSSSSFRAFTDWYEWMSNAARSPTARAYPSSERPALLLSAVREATRSMLAPVGWQDIDWDFNERRLIAEHPEHGRLPLDLLSDGVRNMIALVADLAHRCVRLNPHLGDEAPRKTPGVLIIDEVDMHLHPRWQQLVIEQLRKTFPAMQMMVSTHSPHVLSTVDVSSIRVIALEGTKGVLRQPTFQTKGVTSADVLAQIMDVYPVPAIEEAKWLEDYRGYIEDGLAESKEALALREQLLAHFTRHHPVMMDCDRLIRFQAFKLRRAERSEGSPS
ncbi:MAG: AAA family ATPase [Polyangiaceae bacterium]